MTVVYTTPTISKPKSEGGGNIYEYYLTVDLLSQSIANNTSTVQLTLYMLTNAGTGKQWDTIESHAPTSSITIDGTTYASDVNSGSSSGTYYIVNGKFRLYYRSRTAVAIATKTLTVSHDSVGAKTLTFSYNWIRGSGTTTDYYPKSFASGSYTYALPTIARVGVVECDSALLIDSLVGSFSYAVRVYVSGWYYRLKYSVDGNNGYVWGYDSSGTATSPMSTNARETSLTVAFSALLDRITTGTVKNLVFTLTTYSDSAGTTVVGSSTKTVVVSIDTSVFKPTASLGIIGPYSTPISGKLIAGKSSAQVSFSASKPEGATALTTAFSTTRGRLVSYSSSSLTGTVRTETLPASSSDYTFKISARSTDSRGVSGVSVESTSPTVYGYVAPSIQASAMRVASSGSTSEDGAGTWVCVRFKAICNSSVGGSNSIVTNTISCKYTATGHTNEPVSVSLVDGEYRGWFALGSDDTATVVISVADTVLNATSGSVSTTLTVQVAKYPLDLYDDGTAQHMGVGLAGAMAESDKTKSAKDIYAPNLIVGSTADDSTRQVRVSSNAGELKLFANAGVNSTRGLWAPAHGTGANTDVIVVDANNNVSFYGNATSASKVSVYPSLRPASANQVFNDGSMTHFLSSSSMTTGKPVSDGHIINCQWDNSNINGVQLYMNHSNAHEQLGLRTSGSSWRDWEYADMRRQIWAGTCKGGSSVSVDCTAYSYIRVWVHAYDICFDFCVDLTKAPLHLVSGGSTTNTTFRGSGVAPLYTTGASSVRIENYYCVVEVPSAKTSISVLQIGYFYGSGTRQDRNNNDAYYIYKVEGYL